MYTLRQVNEDGSLNQILGREYNLVNRFEHTKKFRKYYLYVFDQEHVADLDLESTKDSKNIIGFVINENGAAIPICFTDSNYIMLEGKTVDTLNKSMTLFYPKVVKVGEVD